MNHVLAGFEYPYNPRDGDFSGLNIPKKRADYSTFSGNHTFSWGLDVTSATIFEAWEYMDDDFYQTLLTLYENDLEYSYRFGDGYVYFVKILNLEASYYGEYYGTKYWSGVGMELTVNRREALGG